MKLVVRSIVALVMALASALVDAAPSYYTYEKCGLHSSVNFKTWFDSKYLFTNSPVLFPRNDAELSEIVAIAKAGGCKVRVRGAGHSKDGVVMQKQDELEDFDTVVVNLKDYTPDDSSWDGVIDPSKPSVKISTGVSLMEMQSIVRSSGYLPESVMDGLYFSVGGSYLNPSCHGATMDASRLAAQVLSFRVMDADGVITEYSDDASVKDFRGSMGLLGIVTAMEIQLVEDDRFEMTLDQIDVGGYSDEDFRTLIARKYDEFDGIQLQWFVYTDTLLMFQNKFSAGEPIDKDAVQSYYDAQLEEFPDLGFNGGNANALVWLVNLLAGFVTMTKALAATISGLSIQMTIDSFNSVASLSRDGFYIGNDLVPNIDLIHLFIPCGTDCVDETVDLFKQSRDFAKDIVDSNSDWYPTLPLDWRVITVQPDEMLLDNLSPGKWLSWEYFTLFVDGDTTDTKYLKQLEDMWRSSYPGAQVHLGKAYGFGTVEGVGDKDEEFPFQDDSILDNVFTPAVKQEFKSKMDQYDPSETFRAGSVLRLLEETDSKYTPKQFLGHTCEAYEDAECLSGCCDYKFLATDVCVRSDKPKNERCERDCECGSNNCRWYWFKKVCR